MIDRNKILHIATAVVAVAIIICAIVIASRQMGIVEGYDFDLTVTGEIKFKHKF